MYELRQEHNPLGLYVVRKGDTLASVCAAFGCAPAALIAENRLSAFPAAGALLVVPPAAGREYVVRAGDTIKSVCAAFGCTEQEFVRMNGCAYVYPTQRVRIPDA